MIFLAVLCFNLWPSKLPHRNKKTFIYFVNYVNMRGGELTEYYLTTHSKVYEMFIFVLLFLFSFKFIYKIENAW